ncbi:hypothetical protein C8J56DRAFT_956050 [Mycena floridula]|nr:hypothetical protein C8J56DRAFT_956050 [Mycena floridula]
MLSSMMTISNTSSSPGSSLSSSSSVERKGPRPSRTNSLRIPLAKPIVKPPPSLLKSTFLAPGSIFQKPTAPPTTPTKEDELWLQDTVPQSPSSSGGLKSHRLHFRSGDQAETL